MQSNKLKKMCSKVVVKAAYKMAILDANTACPCVGYQPKIPKSVKQLRKF